jgi:hypothetical protein
VALPASADPIAQVLRLSVISVGAPFFALATSAPLLQRWFATARRGTTVDPYFLYAASNVGSFASLILYPVVIEPALTLSAQRQVWSIGYAVAVALTLLCAVVMWRRAPRSIRITPERVSDTDVVTWKRRARWIALAFVPSSLMLAVTAYLSTDVAAIPLLWVLPLGLYLMTFVIAFSRYSTGVMAFCRLWFPLVILYLTWHLVSEVRLLLIPMIVTHLFTFFVIAMLCHGTLAEDRPVPAHLTDFYLSLAVGGALGGMFNSLLAPVLFDSILEYPLALACGVLLLATRPRRPQPPATGRTWIKPVVVAALTLVALAWPDTGVSALLIVGALLLVAVVLCLSVSRSPKRFGFCVALMLGLSVIVGGRGFMDADYASRTFFGTYRVVFDRSNRSYTMFHGTTIHGQQRVGSDEPMTYFHKDSPIAQVFSTRPAGAVTSVGVAGLGIGTLAAYRQPGQRWLFYEIDAEVERIARDERFFTHLRSCGAACEVVIGDARLSLQYGEDMHDVIVLDAFSSDAIPVHLLTREAIELYLAHLNRNGVLVMNISNNNVDLRPVVAGLMRDLGLTGRLQLQIPKVPLSTGLFPSHWAVLARSEEALGPIADDTRWKPLVPGDTRVWTDDFSNLWSVLTWRD